MDLKKIILIAFVLSGMAALIYEVTWTRPLQFVLGSTIYTISIIFSAFMLGLALGSWLISKYVDRIKNLPSTYALLELGIGLYGILLLSIFNLLPDTYRAIYSLRENFYFFEFIQFLLSFGVILIPTTLMGATFPVIAKFYTEQKVGKGIGEIYSANNLGAIVGSFSAGFLLIPILGIKPTIIFAGLINLFVAGLILFISSKSLAIKIIPIVITLFFVLSYTTNYDIEKLYSGGFWRAQYTKEAIMANKILYYKEGLHATISVVKEPTGVVALLINGKGQGSTAIADARVNLLLAYLPILLNPESENALVIGLGTGTTSGHLAQFVNTITVEIEPAVVDAAKYFKSINLEVLNNSNHTLIIADARNYLFQSKEKWDIIASELNDPWYSFSSPLFSKQFFELAKGHLSDKGLFLNWVPVYEFTSEDFKSLYRTFKSVFPYVLGVANLKEEEQLPVKLLPSEIILVGSKQPIKLENLVTNFDKLPWEAKIYLKFQWINSPYDLLNLVLFTDVQLEDYANDAPMITDDNPILEFSTVKTALVGNPVEVFNDISRFLGEKK